jgi:hypothetical protein
MKKEDQLKVKEAEAELECLTTILPEMTSQNQLTETRKKVSKREMITIKKMIEKVQDTSKPE